MNKLIPTIGIEVHIELISNAKIFSQSENSYGGLPNTKTNIIDLGYPGSLPTINKKIVEQGLKIALSLNSKINKLMTFDRKIYFYPDLSKGYQLTQRLTPIGYDGYIEIISNGKIKRINIEEMHIEEDTAKSIHENDKTLLNYNRSGIPLIEIVSKPDISNEEEAYTYLESLRLIMLYLGVSDVKIEEGSMRCDANISLKKEGSNILGTKVEIKNIGSISDVSSAISYEIKRQEVIINSGKEVISETRRWDSKTNSTIAMRIKNEESFLFFPDPDIPKIKITDEWLNNIKNNLPILPNELKNKYIEYNINDVCIKTLLQNKNLCLFYELVIKDNVNKINAANILTGDILSFLNKKNIDINETKLTVENYIKLLKALESNTISKNQAKDIIPIMMQGSDVNQIIKDKNMIQLTDDNVLRCIIIKIIEENNQSVLDYINGNDRALKHLMGMIMKETKQSANPVLAKDILIEELEKNS